MNPFTTIAEAAPITGNPITEAIVIIAGLVLLGFTFWVMFR